MRGTLRSGRWRGRLGAAERGSAFGGHAGGGEGESTRADVFLRNQDLENATIGWRRVGSKQRYAMNSTLSKKYIIPLQTELNKYSYSSRWSYITRDLYSL